MRCASGIGYSVSVRGWSCLGIPAKCGHCDYDGYTFKSPERWCWKDRCLDWFPTLWKHIVVTAKQITDDQTIAGNWQVGFKSSWRSYCMRLSDTSDPLDHPGCMIQLLEVARSEIPFWSSGFVQALSTILCRCRGATALSGISLLACLAFQICLG